MSGIRLEVTDKYKDDDSKSVSTVELGYSTESTIDVGYTSMDNSSVITGNTFELGYNKYDERETIENKPPPIKSKKVEISNDKDRAYKHCLNSELTHLLDNLASCPENFESIYDTMGKIAQLVRDNQNESELIPASAHHVERLGRIIISKLETLTPHKCDGFDDAKKDICTAVKTLTGPIMSAISALGNKIDIIDRKLKGLHSSHTLLRDIHKLLHNTNHPAQQSDMTILTDA